MRTFLTFLPNTTSLQRWNNVIVTSERSKDVETTFIRRYVSTRKLGFCCAEKKITLVKNL